MRMMRLVTGFVCSRRMTGGGVACPQSMHGTNHKEDRAQREDDGEEPRCRWPRSSSESLEKPGGANKAHAAHHGEGKHAQRAEHGGPGGCGDENCRGQRPARKERGAETDEEWMAPEASKRPGHEGR